MRIGREKGISWPRWCGYDFNPSDWDAKCALMVDLGATWLRWDLPDGAQTDSRFINGMSALQAHGIKVQAINASPYSSAWSTWVSHILGKWPWIAAVEMGNEVNFGNLNPNFASNAAGYATQVCVPGFAAVRNFDPTIDVITAGLGTPGSGTNDPPTFAGAMCDALATYHQQNGRYPWDQFGIHPYDYFASRANATNFCIGSPLAGSTNGFPDCLAVHNMLVSKGDTGLVQQNECGVPMAHSFTDNSGAYTVTYDVNCAATWLTAFLNEWNVHNWCMGWAWITVQSNGGPSSWSCDSDWGLITPDVLVASAVKRPTYNAYKAATLTPVNTPPPDTTPPVGSSTQPLPFMVTPPAGTTTVVGTQAGSATIPGQPSSTIHVQAEAFDPESALTSVKILIDVFGAQIPLTFTGFVWEGDIDTLALGLADGTHHLVVQATSAGGTSNSGGPQLATIDLRNTVPTDTTAPIVAWIAPTNGQTVGAQVAGSATLVTLRASADDPESGINAAWFQVNGGPQLTATLQSGEWRYAWDSSTVADAANVSLRFTARNGVGLTSFVDIGIGVDNQPATPPADTTAPVGPSGSGLPLLDAPASGAQIGVALTGSSLLSLAGEASDPESGVIDGAFLIGPSLVVHGTLSGGVWRTTYDTRGLTDGTYTVVFRATNGVGLHADSTGATLTVGNTATPPAPDTTPPAVSLDAIVSPVGTGVGAGSPSLALHGHATDAQSPVTAAHFTVDGALILAATAVSAVDWDGGIDLTSLTNGTHSVSFTATSQGGTSTTGPRSFTVTNQAIIPPPPPESQVLVRRPLALDDIETLRTRTIRSKLIFELIDPYGNTRGDLHPTVGTGTVRWTTGDTIRRTCEGLELPGDEWRDIEVFRDRLRVSWKYPVGEPEPIGTFLFGSMPRRLTTPTEATALPALRDFGAVTKQKIWHSVGYGTGTNVATAIRSIFDELGFDAHVDDLGIQLAAPSAWPIGSITWGEILDNLAKLNACHPHYFDALGVGVVRFVPTINDESADFFYVPGANCTVTRQSDPQESDNALDAANLFIVTDGSAGAVPVVGSYELPPDAPSSKANRGYYVADPETMNGVPSSDAATRQAIANATAAQSQRTISFTTVPEPRHDGFNTLWWGGDGLVYLETGWELPLTAEGPHHHDAQRAVNVTPTLGG